MRFDPPCCPSLRCPSQRSRLPRRIQRKGAYRRRCDGRLVPRFRCLHCRRSFSSQTFRLDYRLRKPWLNPTVAQLLCAKTTLRKMAEILGVDRKTIEARLELFGAHCRDFHESLLRRHRGRTGGLRGAMMMDELETFERDRRLCPITVPVLIEKHSYFVVHVETAPLGPRGRLSEADQKRRERYEDRFGRRRSGSREAVRRTLQAWKEAAGPQGAVQIETDRKSSYRGLLREVFPVGQPHHATHSSKAPRTYANPLFPINHTNALLRDSVSRLVRRSWGASKERWRLERHLWVFVVFRNYVRGITRRARRVSSAMAAGVVRRMLSWSEVLRWRWPFFGADPAHSTGPDSV